VILSYNFMIRCWTIENIRLSVFQVCKPFQRRQAWHEERRRPKHVEGFELVDASAHRLLRNDERRFLFLPDNRIPFVTCTDEIAVVDPLLSQELDLFASCGRFKTSPRPKSSTQHQRSCNSKCWFAATWRYILKLRTQWKADAEQ